MSTEQDLTTHFPLGTPVLAWTGTRDDAPRWTKTRSGPWKLPAGDWVVLVEGITGGVALSHIERIPDGWLSPEEHAEYVAMEGRFSELLCDLTDGLLSKTGYDVRAMVQQVEETFQKYADEDIKAARLEAWDEGKAAAYNAERDGLDGSEVANPYRDEQTRIADGDDEPPALEAS